MKKNGSNTVFSALISIIITVMSLSLFRFYFVGDLMDHLFVTTHSFQVFLVITTFALLLPFLFLSILAVFYKLFRIELIFERSPVIKWLGFFLVGILLFFWGFASSRTDYNYLWSIIQGIVSITVFSLSYFSIKRLFETWRYTKFQVTASIFILAVWGIFTAFLVSKSFDYLNSPIPAEFIEPDKNSPNILLLGIDGMDWRITNLLIDSGELPNFESLIDNGAFAPLHTIKPTVSPAIWNTIFTGYMPEIHQYRPSVISLPFNTIFKRNHSRIPDPFQFAATLFIPSNRKITHYPLAFWDILMRLGYSSAIIGTCELLPLSCKGMVNAFANEYSRYDLAKLNLENHYYCNDVIELVNSINIRQDEIPDSEWSFFTISGEIPQELFATRGKGGGNILKAKRLRQLRKTYATDRYRYLLGKNVLPMLQKPFCMMIYLQGVDIMCHNYMHLYENLTDSAEEEDLKQTIQKYYQKVDEWVGEIIASTPPNTIVLVVYDHGFDRNLSRATILWSGDHRFAPSGILIISGPNIPRGRLEKADILDITPTILDLTGSPELANMQGRSVFLDDKYGLFVEDWYNMRTGVSGLGDTKLQNPEIVKRLKAIGYVK
ncbi:alkaline phosphatase family protein [bacterium]|nr:alkaline phosphatase family protein [Bacteroidota bacterium]MBL7190569.1 alkaline phosphatase family protein [bacterium]